jgi:uncharacterized membrane protein
MQTVHWLFIGIILLILGFFMMVYVYRNEKLDNKLNKLHCVQVRGLPTSTDEPQWEIGF